MQSAPFLSSFLLLPMDASGTFYLKGNYVDGWPDVTADNSLGVVF
jgi:hypothetical protein